MPITKRMEIITTFQVWLMITTPTERRIKIIMGNQVCFISQMNINYAKNDGKRSFFLQIQSVNNMYPNLKNIIIVPITKRMEIIMSFQVWLISWMNINYKKNGGKKSFSFKSKHQYRESQYGKHDCSAHEKKNGDYNEYPSLSNFTMNINYKGNGGKEGFCCKSKALI